MSGLTMVIQHGKTFIGTLREWKETRQSPRMPRHDLANDVLETGGVSWVIHCRVLDEPIEQLLAKAIIPTDTPGKYATVVNRSFQPVNGYVSLRSIPVIHDAIVIDVDTEISRVERKELNEYIAATRRFIAAERIKDEVEETMLPPEG